VNVTILGATGPTGRHLLTQALERGHTVTAVARNPDRLELPAGAEVARVAADVRDTAAMATALRHAQVLISVLGNPKGGTPDVLTTAAAAVTAAHDRGEVERIVWLGAFGTGQSAKAAGPFTRGLLRVALRGEISDKVRGDGLVLQAGGSVLHAGPLTNGDLSAKRRTLDLDSAPHLFPRPVSRATVAAAMLDEAETPRYAGRVAVAVG